MSVIETPVTADEQRLCGLVDQLIETHPPVTTSVAEFLGAQFDLGLAWVHFDEGLGGLGLNPKLQRVVNDRVRQAGGPFSMARNPIGYGMCGPTVHVWGSDAQKQRYL